MRGVLSLGLGLLLVCALVSAEGRQAQAEVSAVCAATSQNAPLVWTVPGLQRVGQNDPPGEENDARLSAARGEYEGFQVVVRGEGRLTGLTLEVSDLVGPGGAVIGKSNLTRYRQHYVRVGRSSPSTGVPGNDTLGPGMYADALIPFTLRDSERAPQGRLRAGPVELAAGVNQPYWVDVFVPRGARPGIYRGKFTVLSAQGCAGGEIELRVWNFELPLKPSLGSLVPLWVKRTPEARAELLRHRLMPDGVEPGEEGALAERYGLRSLNLGLQSGAYAENCSVRRPPPTPQEVTALKTRRGGGLDLLNFAFDETDGCPNLLGEVRAWGRALHAAGVKQLATLTPTPALLDDGSGSGRSAVDIFVLAPEMYVQARRSGVLEAVRAKNVSLWSYSALLRRDTPQAPPLLLDYPPLNYRIWPGFLNQSLGMEGFLYWAADFSGGSLSGANAPDRDPWQDPGFVHQGVTFQGDGLLAYPGDPVGMPNTVVPSLRLKWLRDGVEDYEYVQLLMARGRGELASEMVRTVAGGLERWSRFPSTLEAARTAMGESLNLR